MYIKKKLSQLYKNFKNLVYFIRIGEYPVKSIYTSNLNFKSLDVIKKDSTNLVMSSNNKFLFQKRILDFNKMSDCLTDYSFYFFSHTKRDRYMRKNWNKSEIFEIYKKSIFQQMKADIFRYCFLFDNGGYWLDIKSNLFFDPKKLTTEESFNQILISSNPILDEEIINNNKNLLHITENRKLTNWFIGARQNSAFLQHLLSNIIKDYPSHKNIVYTSPKKAILDFTGPNQLTKSFYEYENKSEISLIDEAKYDIEHEAKFGRKLNLFDDVFYQHYSKVENSIIVR